MPFPHKCVISRACSSCHWLEPVIASSCIHLWSWESQIYVHWGLRDQALNGDSLDRSSPQPRWKHLAPSLQNPVLWQGNLRMILGHDGNVPHPGLSPPHLVTHSTHHLWKCLEEAIRAKVLQYHSYQNGPASLILCPIRGEPTFQSPTVGPVGTGMHEHSP